MTPWPTTTTTTMTALINAILATIRAHTWPSEIAAVGYRAPFDFDDADEPAAMMTPAILLTITDRETEPEARTPPGRVARRCAFELHGVLSSKTENLQVELLELSESIYAMVEARDAKTSHERGNHWGLGDAVGVPFEIRDSDQGAYAAGVHGYDGRVVSWSQVVYLPDRVSS